MGFCKTPVTPSDDGMGIVKYKGGWIVPFAFVIINTAAYYRFY
jgi:hypothetical protein